MKTLRVGDACEPFKVFCPAHIRINGSEVRKEVSTTTEAENRHSINGLRDQHRKRIQESHLEKKSDDTQTIASIFPKMKLFDTKWHEIDNVSIKPGGGENPAISSSVGINKDSCMTG